MKYHNFIPIIVFSVLSLIIVFPLLPSGFILTLDTIPVPKVFWPSFFSPSFLFGTVISVFNLIAPYMSQKIIVFTIFFMAGWGMYRLIPSNDVFAKLFGGLLYAVNPFVYERVMAGHWHLLLGYSLFPFFISEVISFFDHPSKLKAIRLAVLTTIIFSIVIHFSLIVLVFLLIYTLLLFIFQYGKTRRALAFLPFFIVGVFILNLNWLVPVFIGRSDVIRTISGFTSEDLIAFQSVEDKHFGLIFNLASGYGFWPEVHKYFILPKDIIFFWPLLSLIFIGLFITGIVRLIREKNKEQLPLLITLVILFLLSLDFAGGVALKSFVSTVVSLYESFPILRGFREPQKLIGIIMLCYAFFGSFGISEIVGRINNKLKISLLAVFFTLPFIYTPTVFGGFWGQLKPVFYPESWNKVNTVLNTDKDNYLVLFFPWHQYMRFNFNNNLVVANPASYYFDKPIISSRNYETMPLYTHDIRPEALHVEGLLTIEKEGVNLLGEQVEEKLPWGQSLSPIGVKYIILAKDDDWQTYKFIENQPDLKKVYESSDIDLYQNLEWGKEEPPPIDNAE